MRAIEVPATISQEHQNLLIGVLLLAAPVLAEFAAFMTNTPSGIGIDVFAYEPFDGALLIVALFAFVLVNIRCAVRSSSPLLNGLLAGLLATAAWAFLAFLAVAQLHVLRGGVL